MGVVQTALLLSSLVLGLAGGSHCVAMCGPACIAISQGRAPTASVAEQPIHYQARPSSRWRQLGQFLAARAISYASAGAVFAGTIQALAWGSQLSSAMQPLWAIWHAMVLVWGLILLLSGRQPIWAEQQAQRLWLRLSQGPWAGRSWGLGLVWGLLPCGLLYSAFLQASLTGQALWGAVAMLLFALGSGLWLLATPVLWHHLKKLPQSWGQRLAGLLLIAGAIFAIWMQFQPGGIYCAT